MNPYRLWVKVGLALAVLLGLLLWMADLLGIPHAFINGFFLLASIDRKSTRLNSSHT